MRKQNTLILFSKSPRICRVKTRLWPALNHRQCLAIHKALTSNLIKSLKTSKLYNLVIYNTYSKSKYNYPFNVQVKTQQGLNLGMRMHNAFKHELKHAQRVVLIGSDCLDLSASHIESAFSNLASINDVVLNPTDDGGYCLVGMRETHKYLFEKISWGSSKVLNQTLTRANQRSHEIKLLKTMRDIDTVSDLHVLDKERKLPDWAKIYLS